MVKPILIRCGGLTGRIYAIRRYSERDGLLISSSKEDATDDAIDAVIEHKLRGCESLGCRCMRLTLDSE